MSEEVAGTRTVYQKLIVLSLEQGEAADVSILVQRPNGVAFSVVVSVQDADIEDMTEVTCTLRNPGKPAKKHMYVFSTPEKAGLK